MTSRLKFTKEMQESNLKAIEKEKIEYAISVLEELDTEFLNSAGLSPKSISRETTLNKIKELKALIK